MNKKLIIGAGVLLVILAFFILPRVWANNIKINNNDSKTAQIEDSNSEIDPACNGQNRPFAVMVSSDKEARPLSGIGSANIVFEMPVLDIGFTRMMAVFYCGSYPKEIGSVRSSRLDFVPLALGIHAIYAHFGGEHTVLEELNSGVIDNIDGLKYDGTIYYRKTNIPRPHNAFTNFDLLKKVSDQLGYSLSDDSPVIYPMEKNSKSQGDINPPSVFPNLFKVQWQYDKNSNSYLRSRSGLPEIDKNTESQVSAKNVAILQTTAAPINVDYMRVNVIGTGSLRVYKDGTVVSGTWEKQDNKAKLYFYDENHKEIQFAPGSLWVEIDAHLK